MNMEVLMKNVQEKIPENFEELMTRVSSLVSFCKYAKFVEKEENKFRIVFNVREFGSGVDRNQIKGLCIRNDVYEKQNIIVVFLEDCIGYPQVLELNIKQAFYLCLSLLEE